MTKLSDWIDMARRAEKSGDPIIAYDLAKQGLKRHPSNIELQYLAIRALARSGATDQAAALYDRLQLHRRDELDIAMLGARISKDRALGASANRRDALRAVATTYRRIYSRTRDPYCAVNAATLSLLAGDQQRALSYACRTLETTPRRSVKTSTERYYPAVGSSC